MKIISTIVTKNPCYTAGEKITVKGLMLHSVGCNQPSASVFVKIFDDVNYSRCCVHAFIDGNTGDIHQTLPWNHRGWHAGKGAKGSANNTHIGVEMCEPACIKYTGGSTFTCSDLPVARAVAQRTYDNAVALFAHLCKEYKLDPLADGVIISHKEGCKRGIASNHGDPEHLWNGLKMGYTMDGFRRAVKAAMSAEKDKAETAPVPDKNVLYRVQVGAFSESFNADNLMVKIKGAGFTDAYKTFSQDDKLYRIQVGAYAIKANAEKKLAEVKEAGFPDAFIKVNQIESAPPMIKKGDWVRVRTGAKTYTGGGLAPFVYGWECRVSEVVKDRVVITRGGVVIAAVHARDLIRL
jgi:N-acetylmuramoyl-L-alanine amidase CwlA